MSSGRTTRLAGLRVVTLVGEMDPAVAPRNHHEVTREAGDGVSRG